jgi:predicted dehydrogenase
VNRYHPYNRTIRQWIRDGHLGEVEAVHWHLLWDAHTSFGKLATRRARAAERTGSLDCGIHQLDLTRYFFGGAWDGSQDRKLLDRAHEIVLATVARYSPPSPDEARLRAVRKLLDGAARR